MQNSKITKEQFLNLTLNDVIKVYSGKRNCCRCGCGGEYTYTQHTEEKFHQVNDNLVMKRLSRAKNLANKDGVDVMYGETYVDVQTGKDRTLTFYFKK
jgi:hypothetical protein